MPNLHPYETEPLGRERYSMFSHCLSPTQNQDLYQAENEKQFYIPEGFAHGFLVLSDEAEFAYKCTDFYHPGDEGGLLWNDETIGVQWPITEDMEVLLSEKDTKWGKFDEIFKFEK